MNVTENSKLYVNSSCCQIQVLAAHGFVAVPDKTCMNCKPIAPAAHARQVQQADGESKTSRVIYGSDHYYYFFRLHQHLLERSGFSLLIDRGVLQQWEPLCVLQSSCCWTG